MKKTELKELYTMMFPNYPDIVTVKQLQVMNSSRQKQNQAYAPFRLSAASVIILCR